jgi:hypothetical protein
LTEPRMMAVCLPEVMFSITLAPGGIGKLIDPALTVLPGLDEPDAGREAAECEEDAAGLEAVGAAAVIPAEHAASDRLAAQVTKASAAER